MHCPLSFDVDSRPPLPAGWIVTCLYVRGPAGVQSGQVRASTAGPCPDRGSRAAPGAAYPAEAGSCPPEADGLEHRMSGTGHWLTCAFTGGCQFATTAGGKNAALALGGERKQVALNTVIKVAERLLEAATGGLGDVPGFPVPGRVAMSFLGRQSCT